MSAITGIGLSIEGGKGDDSLVVPEDKHEEVLPLLATPESSYSGSGNWGGGLSSTSSYQIYSDEQQDYTHELYVAVMNHFSKIGGYGAMLGRVDPNLLGTGTGSLPHHVATLPEMKVFQEILYAGVPCYSSAFVMEFFPKYRQASYARLDKLSLDELRDCGDAGREVLDTIHSLGQLLSSLQIPLPMNNNTLYSNDADHEMCLASLTRQLVDCPFLKARLRGMTLLAELIDAVYRGHEAREQHFSNHSTGQQQVVAMPQPHKVAFHWLTCDLLSTWIYEKCIIESAIAMGYGYGSATEVGKGETLKKGDNVMLLRGNTGGSQIGRRELHPEVLKRSEPIFLFMAFTGKLSSRHIDLLWKAGEDSVQDTRRASHSIFIHLASEVDEPLLDRMHELLKSLPKVLNKAHIELIKGFSGALLNRGLDCGEARASSTDTVPVSGEDQKESTWLPIFGSCVELLWKATQESAPVSPEVRTAALDALTEVLSCRDLPMNGGSDLVDQRRSNSAVSGWVLEGGVGGIDNGTCATTKYTPTPVLHQLKCILKCCSENVVNQTSVVQNIQLMQSLLSAQLGACELPVRDDSRSGLILELEKRYGIMGMALWNLLEYSQEVRKKIPNRLRDSNNNAIMEECLAGNVSHRDTMVIHLDFLRFTSRYMPMRIPFSTIESLWEIIVVDPLCSDESELFFDWLLSILECDHLERSTSGGHDEYNALYEKNCNILYRQPPSPSPHVVGGEMVWEIVDDATTTRIFMNLLCSNEFNTVDIGPLGYACYEMVFQFVNMKSGALSNSLHPNSAVIVENYYSLSGLEGLWDMFLRNKNKQVSDIAGSFFIRLHSLNQYASEEESLNVSKEFINRWCMTSLKSEVDLMEIRTGGSGGGATTFYPIHSTRIVKLLSHFLSGFENASPVDPSSTNYCIQVVVRNAVDHERKAQGQTAAAAPPPSSHPSISTLSFTCPRNEGTPVQLRALIAQQLRVPPQNVRLQNFCNQFVVTPRHDNMPLNESFHGNYCQAIILPSPAKDTLGWDPPKDASTVGWCSGTLHSNVHRLISESEENLSVLFRLLEGWHGSHAEGLLETRNFLKHLPVNERLQSVVKSFGKRKSPPEENEQVVMLFDEQDHVSQLYILEIICDIIAPSFDPYSLPGDKAVADAWIAGFLYAGGMQQLLDLIPCSDKQQGLDTGNKLHRICLALLLRVITTFTLLDSIPSECSLLPSTITAADDDALGGDSQLPLPEIWGGSNGRGVLHMDESEGGGRENSLLSSGSSSRSNCDSSSTSGSVCISFTDELVDTVHTQNFIKRLYAGVDLDDLSERMLNIMTSVCRAGAHDDGIGHLTPSLENLKLLHPKGGHVLRAASLPPPPHGHLDRRGHRSLTGSATTEASCCDGMPINVTDPSSQLGRKSELLEHITLLHNELPPEAEVVQHTMTILSAVTLCTPHLLDTILHFPDFGVAMNFILLHASESSVRTKVSYGVYKMAESLCRTPTPTCRREGSNATADGGGGGGPIMGVVQQSSSPDPVSFFILELLKALPSVEKYKKTCSQYFRLLSSLIGLSSGLPAKWLIELCHQLSKCISQKECCEATEECIDLPLQGYMSLLLTVLRTLAAGGEGKQGTETSAAKAGNRTTVDCIKREIGIDLVPELLQNCLFSPPPTNAHNEEPIRTEVDSSSVPLPKCKHPESRHQAFLLLIELTRRQTIMYRDKEGRGGSCDVSSTTTNLAPDEMFNDNFILLLEGLSPHHKLTTDAGTNRKDGRSRSRGSSIGDHIDGGANRSSVNVARAYNGTLHPVSASSSTKQQQLQVQQHVQHSGPLKSSRHTPRRHYNGYCGLKNLGCICYMNATLQQLFMIPGFRDGVLAASDGCLDSSSHEGSSGCDKVESPLWQLQNLFSHLLALEKSYYNPIGFCNALVNIDGEPMDVFEQQDADEFVLSLFQQIEDRVMGTPSEHIIKDIFGGLMVNELIADGGWHSERSEAFNMIKVDVKDYQNLLEGLSSYVAGETVDYTWEHEHVETGEKMVAKLPTTKRVLLKSLPESLIIHLKRFEFDFELMQQMKINDRYEFPMELDLYPYTKEGVNAKEEGLDDPDGHRSDLLYTLMGVVVHIGTANSGHYYSIIKERGSSNRWFEFNDMLVTEFDPQDIPAECFGGVEEGSMDKRSYFRNAFMLVYDKVSKPSLNEEGVRQIVDTATGSERLKNSVPQKILCQKERKHHRYASIPHDILRDIQCENMMYWRRCNITDESYYDFMMELCGRPHVDHHITCHFYEGAWPTEMIKLATKFVLGTLHEAGEAWLAIRWLYGALQHQYEMNDAARNWLLCEFDQCPEKLMNLVTSHVGYNGKSFECHDPSCVTVSSLLFSIVLECVRKFGCHVDKSEVPFKKLINALVWSTAKSPTSPETCYWINIIRAFASRSDTRPFIIDGGLLYLLMESVPSNSAVGYKTPQVDNFPSKLGPLLELIAFLLSPQSAGAELLPILEDNADASSRITMPSGRISSSASAVPPLDLSHLTGKVASLLTSRSFLSSVVGECRAPTLQCHAKPLLRCLAYENKTLSQHLSCVIVYIIESSELSHLIKAAMRAALILISSVHDSLSEWRCNHIMNNLLPAIKRWTFQGHAEYVLLEMLLRIAEVSDHARNYLCEHREQWKWAFPLVEEKEMQARARSNRWDTHRYASRSLCTIENIQSICEVIIIHDFR